MGDFSFLRKDLSIKKTSSGGRMSGSGKYKLLKELKEEHCI
jgi:hypothetical protein